MALEVHFGNVLLRDDPGVGMGDIKVEPHWNVILEDAFRSPQPYGRGNGNAHRVVRFRLASVHGSRAQSLNWQQNIYSSLYGNNLETPRELWYIDTVDFALPVSFGLSLPREPKVIDEGLSDDGYICVTEYEFVCGLLANDALDAAGDAEAEVFQVPNLWLPNEFGIVLRRTTDDVYIRWTRDFGTDQDILDILSGDPGTTDYELTLNDVEASAATRGFGFFRTTPSENYCLINLQDIGPATAPQNASASDEFADGYTSDKGLIFASGTGPILLTPDGRRFRVQIGAGPALEFVLL